jgi:nucleotidyltransferase/DNA polymerase involved in DNA repair
MTRILALVWPELRDPEADPRPWERMLDALDDLSPRVEAVDLGVALVDVTGLGPMWGPERRIAARAVALVRGVAPLRVRCGVGENRWLASLAARLARLERPEAPAAFGTLERDALAALPLTLLPADPATRQRLALFGLRTMGQLASLPRSAVGAQFGPAGERLQALARGHDPRPLVPRRRPERVEAGVTFETPLDGVGAVGLTLRRLAAELCDRLGERHLAPGRAVLTVALEDAPALRVAQPFPQPALEPDWIARLLLSRLEAAARARRLASTNPAGGRRNLGALGRAEPGQTSVDGAIDPPSTSTVGEWKEPTEQPEEYEPRVASVKLILDRLADPATHQLPAFEARAGRWEELRWSLERIRHRFGEGRLWRAVADRPMAALPEHRSRLVDIGR